MVGVYLDLLGKIRLKVRIINVTSSLRTKREKKKMVKTKGVTGRIWLKNRKSCVLCGNLIFNRSRQAKYCLSCAKNVKKNELFINVC